MRKGCIYLIENKVNNKKYIGQTIKFKKRKRLHLLHLKNNDHHNKHLQNSYNKYGIENFNIKIIENNINRKKLDEKEIYWIDYYNTYNGKGYNLTPGGNVLRGKDNPFYGMQHSKETKERMKANHADVSGENNPMYGVSMAGNKNPMYGKYGENNPNSKGSRKLSIKIIKEYFETNLSYKSLGKKYGFAEATIYRMVACKHWTTEDLKRG